MFPDYLDNAKVLLYTNKAHFGFVKDDLQETEICYLAVCQYPNDPSNFYIFSCDSSYEVVGDGCFWSIDICKTCHPMSERAVWHIK